MKKLEVIRDQLSDIYKNWDDDELVYKEGFDAGVIEMQKIIEPLIKCLEFFASIEPGMYEQIEEFNIAKEALQKYKEAIE